VSTSGDLAAELTGLQNMEPFIPRMDEASIQSQLQELMCYIWDNYVELFEAVDDIFLMGVGSAYLGVKVLLMNRSTYPTLPSHTPPANEVIMFEC